MVCLHRRAQVARRNLLFDRPDWATRLKFNYGKGFGVISSDRFSLLSELLDLVEAELSALETCLVGKPSGGAHEYCLDSLAEHTEEGEPSGPGVDSVLHVACFDALDYILQNCFTELEFESTAVASATDDLLARVGDANSHLDQLMADYQEFNEQESRTREMRAVTKSLVSDIRGEVGFWKVKTEKARIRDLLRTDELGPEPILIDGREREFDTPLRLSGVFQSRRSSGG